MPRGNRYFLPGRTYHLNHRCHDRQFLLRFACDRDAYRLALWEVLQSTPVWLLAYCITSNHVHLLARSDDELGIQTMMQRAEGRFAQYYNRRKQRSGAFWEGRYHSTLIEGPTHLERCITYIELNMVRAGVVSHPKHWPWCSYPEWMGHRRRYRLIDLDRSLLLMRAPSLEEYRKHSEHRIQEAIARGRLSREPHWTGGVAVGEKEFVDEIGKAFAFRRKLTSEECPGGAWVLREDASDLGAWPR